MAVLFAICGARGFKNVLEKGVCSREDIIFKCLREKTNNRAFYANRSEDKEGRPMLHKNRYI